MISQKWKNISQFEKYYAVANYGIVKRLAHRRETKNQFGECSYNVEEKVLKQHKNHKGYYLVTLYKPGLRKTFAVHRLVAEHFVEGDQSLQVNHKDGVKTNNHTDNLEWCSGSQNVQHARLNGLFIPFPDCDGEKNYNARLKQREVNEIRREYAKGSLSYSGLAEEYGVVKSTIASIIKNKTWRKK